MRGVAALEAPDFPAQAAKGDTVQMESLFLLPQGAAFRRGCDPHFSFVLPKEKPPQQRWKRKALVSKLAVERKFGEYGSQLFCSETCLSLRGTGGVRRMSSPVRRDGQAASLRVRKGHPQFLFPRSSRCSALPVPRMSDSGSGTGSRGRPLCRPVNAALPNAGTQFCKERLSAQPVGDFWTLSAVRGGRSPAPEGFPKGRAAARPFVPRGVWGRWRPHVSL